VKTVLRYSIAGNSGILADTFNRGAAPDEWHLQAGPPKRSCEEMPQSNASVWKGHAVEMNRGSGQENGGPWCLTS
jgi:hypothetical protein